MQTYNDVTDINLPLKAVLRWAITERTLSHHVLGERETREELKNQHIDVALFFPHFTAHKRCNFVIMCGTGDLEFIRICFL